MRPGAFELVLRNSVSRPTVASGTFLFNAHWRPTVVRAPVHLQDANRTVVHDVELIVRNHRMVAAHYNFTCTALSGHNEDSDDDGGDD